MQGKEILGGKCKIVKFGVGKYKNNQIWSGKMENMKFGGGKCKIMKLGVENSK